MEPLPLDGVPQEQDDTRASDLQADAERELEGLSAAELLTALRLQADQLNLRESQEVLGPVRERHPDLGRMPAEELRTLVARLAIHLRGRGPFNCIQRYRTGRLLALAPLSGEVWNLLPHAERLRLLEEDDHALDIAQAARHLAKFYLCPGYSALADAAAQRLLVASARYPAVVQRLLALPPQQTASGVFALSRRVTEMALNMEESPREMREPQLQAIRRTIEETLRPPAADQSREHTTDPGDAPRAVVGL